MHKSSIRRTIATLALLTTAIGLAPAAAQAAPTGCTTTWLSLNGTFRGEARCTTAATGSYFRAEIHCKHSDAYGRFTFYKRWSAWTYQGATAKAYAWCDGFDPLDNYVQGPNAVVANVA